MVYRIVFKSFFLREKVDESSQRFAIRFGRQKIFFYYEYSLDRLLGIGRIKREKNAKGKNLTLLQNLPFL